MKNALILGGNGGIGFAFVQHLLQRDNITRIYATYRRPESAEDLKILAQQSNQRLQLLQLDITDEDNIAQVVKGIQQDIKQLHFVINCVGLLHGGELQPEKSLRQLNSDHLIQYFQVNSIGGVLLAKHLLPLLQHKERNVFASISAKIGSIEDNYIGGWYGYRASKAALNMFMRTVAIEYRRKSPQTIIIQLHPGTTDTALSQPFQRNVPPEKLFTCDRTVTQLLNIIDTVTETESGQFFSWDGSKLPW
ncbi:SDR family NAD(P)-dependent oxidoreductase [Spirulina sp. CS-785/01]|uniref:SDR family NAD(P)-dependent oxidoreductase n=1 Tax=Spirulina sp. CS-785/01 TaxID=3021716 RepID=UPI00232DDE7E|nr:SDR family NAD(P)-dependent oxidoreductase [Spirulina sp. CS-785/01]MDB9312061.1 SDR family NAD(P)-dependent oxidoreductase [Spirulina sp. CS-785/01]